MSEDGAVPQTGGPHRAPLTGSKLGRYLVGERLGVGGAASVYLALLRGPHEFERVLALKVVHEHLSGAEDFVNMFLDEANLAVRLNHPGIVHSYELGREGPHLFLAMEYLDGQPLSVLVDREAERGGRLPPALVAWIGARAAEALAHAHALADDRGRPLGLVHRDISPQNVFLGYDGRVKIIDFGIARTEGRLTHTGLGRIKGKFRYMAPEQLLHQRMDHRADLFALGATLYEAAVGVRPFDAADEAEVVAAMLEERPGRPEDHVPGFPEDLGAVLLRSLEREPSRRFDDAGAMADALDRVVERLAFRDPQLALAGRMSALFTEERERRAQAIAEMKEDRPVAQVVRLPVAATVTADPSASTIRPDAEPAPRRPRAVLALAGVAVLAAAVGLVALSRGGDGAQAAAPQAAVAPATVTLEVSVEPPVDAEIRVAGASVTGKPPRAVVPSGSAAVPIVVDAPGFERATVSAVPDRDRIVSIHLAARAPAPAPVAPSAVATPTPAPAPRKPAAARPASGAPRPAGKPRGKDSLVTEYPF